MLTMKGIRYVSPEMKIHEIMVEGVLCLSVQDSGMDMNPEEGKMF